MMRRRHTRLLLAALAALTVAGLTGATTAAAAPAGRNTVVTGRVTGVDGRPLQDVHVIAAKFYQLTYQYAGSADTRADGTYRLVVRSLGIPDLHLQFAAYDAVGGTSPTGYADRCHLGGPLCTDEEPGIATDGTPLVVDEVLPRANVLTGRVTDALGRGVGGFGVAAYADVTATNPIGKQVFYGQTDLNGNYTFPRLDAFDYNVVFGDPVYQQSTPATPNPDGYLGTSTRLTVRGGRVVTSDLTVVGGGGVRGTVVRPDGAPVAGASVYLYTDSVAGGGWPNTTTAADGTFALHFIAPDTAHLCVGDGTTTNCPEVEDGPLVTVRSLKTTVVRVVLPSAP